MYHDGVLLQRAGQFEAAKAALSSLCLNGVRSPELAGTFGMVALRMRDARTARPGPAKPDRWCSTWAAGACLNGAKEYEAAKSGVRTGDRARAAISACALRVWLRAGGCTRHPRSDQGSSKRRSLSSRRACCRVCTSRSRSTKWIRQRDSSMPRRQCNWSRIYRWAITCWACCCWIPAHMNKAVPELEIARKAFPKEGRIDLALATAYAHVGRTQDAAQARAEFARKKQAEQASAEGAVEITDAMDARAKQ